jgi:biopolymer transport protein ExbD
MAANPLPDDGSELSEGIVAEINITPLVDVFLVLLIIFMVTSSVMTQMGMEVQLPKASSESSSGAPEGVIVTLLANGALKVNETSIAAGNEAALEQTLKKLLPQTKNKSVILEGDQKAILGNAIRVMDLAKKAGATGFSIATSLE